MKKFRFHPVVSAIAAALVSFLSPAVYAQDQADNNTTSSSLVQKINTELTAQEETIKQLKAEVSSLKAQQNNVSAAAKSANASAAKAAAASTNAREIRQRLLEVGASPVITAPYLGVPARWDASDLIVNFPTYNEDVLLMKRDYAIDKAIESKGFPHPVNPILELSGKVEAQAWAARPLSGRSQSDIDLSAAEVDFAAHVTDWVNGLASLVYDNSAPNANSSTNAQLVTNSRVYVNQAFITVGDLSRSPFYGTIGQRSLPFGHYSSAMISDTYPQLIFKTRDRAVLLGYHPMINQRGPYVTAFVFKGDTQVGGGQNNINNYGADLGYLFDKGQASGDFGVSGIANVADSLGMQNNGITNQAQFRGYGFAPTTNANATEDLIRRVPGFNVHGKLDIADWTFLGEVNTATSRFAAADMSYNGGGAKPAAAHGEVIYAFNMGQYPSSFAVGYDHTWQALALAIPQSRYITTFSTSLFKDTIESLELKREINYAATDSAGGQNTSVSIPGHYANTVTAQIGYYF